MNGRILPHRASDLGGVSVYKKQDNKVGKTGRELKRNRRTRIRTYGGVRGREIKMTPSYAIQFGSLSRATIHV